MKHFIWQSLIKLWLLKEYFAELWNSLRRPKSCNPNLDELFRDCSRPV